MNGYELIAKMRKTRRKNPLTCSEQALYNELVAMCNDEEWPDVFSCSNYELCNALQISENTLKDARNTLIQAGLIFYKSGKSKRQFSTYSFSKQLPTTSKFDTDAATNGATVTATVGCTNTPESTSKSEDYYKQTKLKEEYKINAHEGDLSKLEIGNTIEFVDRVKQVKLSTDEILNYWAAFNLNGSESAYYSREKKIQHFRNWLKNQKNGITNHTAGSGTNRDKQTAAKDYVLSKLKGIITE